MAISYQTDGIKMPAIKKRETSAWIKAVASSYEKKVGEIAYIFCSDEKILEVNKEYLQHDYYTDIITFDYCEDNDELHRTIIHGILHLCGINDKGEGEREIMEAEENKALTLLK
ncbi:MAG: hypothetical protein H6Q12_1464 [Bacteroidetes bacterium]|nr:hypothetical protein [Bacteroidota bacterium]